MRLESSIVTTQKPHIVAAEEQVSSVPSAWAKQREALLGGGEMGGDGGRRGETGGGE